jgi:hypothetical protein
MSTTWVTPKRYPLPGFAYTLFGDIRTVEFSPSAVPVCSVRLSADTAKVVVQPKTPFNKKTDKKKDKK